MKRRRGAAPIEPPAGLSASSQALWRELVPRRAASPGRLALLEQALRARDRADEASAMIAKFGVMRPDMVGMENAARQTFVRCWAVLHLDWDPDIDGGSA